MSNGPQRRITDHIHPDYWTESEQHRFEDRVAGELNQIRGEVHRIGNRLTLLLGGLTVVVFLVNVVATVIIRSSIP